VFRLRTHEIPDVKRQAKGMPVINLIELDQRERVTALIDMESFGEEQFLVMVTRLGQIKKTPAAAYSAVRRNGLIAMNLQDNDELNWVRVSSGGDEIIVATRQGKCSRYSEREVRPTGRDTQGVAAIRLRDGDEVAGFDIANPNGYVLVVTEKGYGKLTAVSEYNSKGRNIQGMYTIDQTKLSKIGEIVGMRVVEDLSEELMVISTMGQVIRIPLEQVNVQGRQTKGVIIMRMSDDDRVGSVAGVGSPGALDA
ncbi:MAG TPA: DNA gyrase C-terminal beta-propeller domain-containing protein, partial [Candidatus Dormibacteraeota bacterium]|nr:DNA gyrase C-terminal beta-propeller domain-containing protein [Candidatus Dormibacteraeota bacterium]